MPGVEGVHVLAHSRGGGLTMDALSALGNEYQLRGEAFFSALGRHSPTSTQEKSRRTLKLRMF